MIHISFETHIFLPWRNRIVIDNNIFLLDLTRGENGGFIGLAEKIRLPGSKIFVVNTQRSEGILFF